MKGYGVEGFWTKLAEILFLWMTIYWYSSYMHGLALENGEVFMCWAQDGTRNLAIYSSQDKTRRIARLIGYTDYVQRTV